MVSAREVASGLIGAGVGALASYIILKPRPPPDHSSLMSNILFSPPMPEARVEAVCVYTGYEKFKGNPTPTPHSGWLIIEECREKGVYQAMAFVDIWTITLPGVKPTVYTVEIVKLERIQISFTVFGRRFTIAESATLDTSGTSPGYWLAQVKETGEIGEFL